MIRSMTGYGEAQYHQGDLTLTLELRSLNNRYFKANIKLPEYLSAFEAEVEKLLKARISRGSVNYTLRTRYSGPEAAMEINTAVVESYLSQLNLLSVSDNVRIDLGAILALPGVCQAPEINEAELERQWDIVKNLTDQATNHMIEMRQLEGRALREDLQKQCHQIRQHLKTVSSRAPEVVKDYHQKILQRANELLNSAKLQLELDDVKREIAIYSERCDINEEISRLGSHLDQFTNMFETGEPAGRKLDFLAQEMLREANTIASKANDAEIAYHIVEIKGAIDRLKEQVQNVE